MVDPGRSLEPERRDAVAIADRADHRQQLSPGEVSRAAHLLDSLDDVGDLLLRRPLFHHDHHLSSVSGVVTGVDSLLLRRPAVLSLLAHGPFGQPDA